MSVSTVLKLDPACRMRPRAITVSWSTVQGRKNRSDRLTVRTYVPGGALVSAVTSTLYPTVAVRFMNPSLISNHGLRGWRRTLVPELACVVIAPSSRKSGVPGMSRRM
jgi:hypothetical protein